MFFDGVSYVHFSLPGLESISLYDINDKGQILGTDWTGTELTAFLATPVVDTTPNEVPEPSTTLSGILVCGLLLAGARQKVRRGNAG